MPWRVYNSVTTILQYGLNEQVQLLFKEKTAEKLFTFLKLDKFFIQAHVYNVEFGQVRLSTQIKKIVKHKILNALNHFDLSLFFVGKIVNTI